MQIVGDDLQMYGFPVDAAGHHGFERLPVCWCAERQPIGVARPDGAGASPISVGHKFQRGEFDRCQMIRAVGIGKPVDLRLPSGRGHRYPQMVERSAATDERFSRGLVGVHYSTWIEE